MKLRLDATPDELQTKSGKLIKALSELLRPAAPDLSEILEKALPAKEQELKYPVLRELQRRTQKLYEKHIQKMLQEIGTVLDGSKVAKSEFYDHTEAIAEKDGAAYQRIKEVLRGMGYLESDFEPGGPLYGWSTNQLIDLARGKREVAS